MRLGQGLMYGWLEAPDMFDRHVFSLAVAGLKILAQGREDLRIENLESPYSIHHSLELNSFNVVVLAVYPLYSENVVAEVETFEPPLLAEKSYHDAPSPV